MFIYIVSHQCVHACVSRCVCACVCVCGVRQSAPVVSIWNENTIMSPVFCSDSLLATGGAAVTMVSSGNSGKLETGRGGA